MPYKLFPRAVQAFCLLLTLAPVAAQERSPEQYQIAIGMLQRGLRRHLGERVSGQRVHLVDHADCIGIIR